MSQLIKPMGEKKKQWLWFIALWCGGFAAVLSLSMIIKLIMNIG